MKIKHDQVVIQCCTKHWKMMEKAIADRGMDHLISSNSDQAEKCFNEAEGNPWAMTDPLLQAFSMMGAQVINNGISEDKLSEITGKQICPVCLAMDMTKGCTTEDTEAHWTAGLADHILSEYRQRRLLSRLQ